MTSSHSLRIAATLVGLASLAGCGGHHRAAVETTARPATGDPGGPSARAHATPGRYPYTAADVQFMSDMIGHHGQAIVMAGWAPTHGASPSVRRLAERIVNGQQDEIATMQRWLRDRGRPVPEVGTMRMRHLMPGMLTPAEMKRLDEARGPEFDRLFLTSMIQHHRGAVSMVDRLFGTNGAAQDEAVFKFANDVNVDQTTEIARMERLLSTLPAGGPSS